MTPEREKLIRWYWEIHRTAWHETIGDEFKVAVEPKVQAVPYDANVIPLKSTVDMLTFRRDDDGTVRCEGIVLEMTW